jgi:hypothetical protein
MSQAEGRTIAAHVAFDHRVDVLRDLRKAGWIVLELWVAGPGNRGHARRRFSAAKPIVRSQDAKRSSWSGVRMLPLAKVNKGNRPGKVRSVAVHELETADEPPV